ncbi:E3 ubiquitin-protein ligase SIAH1-like isoform X2 [Maniola jurtina]|nr:E3 ubiquitin-protein ligase SIAH1-like isoform X2 [Maniola jurtina]
MELPECPVCMEYMSAPIFQCQSGHSLCNTCTRNLCPPLCPICRQAMTQIRNWQLEDMISKATVPCPNKPAGCVYTMVNMDVDDHLKECIFREMTCPLGAVFGKCFWSGKLNGMLDHFKERHPDNLSADANITINNTSITTDDRHMYLVAQNKFLFIISFKIDTMLKMAYWAVQHIGGKKAAQQHIYEISVTSNQDSRRKAVFTDHCFNDAMDANEIFRQAKCAVMPLAMMAHFLKDKRLTFSFSIKRNNPGFKKGPGPDGENKPFHNKQKGPRSQSKGPHPQPKGPGGNNFQGQNSGPHMHKGPGKGPGGNNFQNQNSGPHKGTFKQNRHNN